MYIAAQELKHKALDILVRRPLPCNRYYEVHVKDMELPEDFHIMEQMLL